MKIKATNKLSTNCAATNDNQSINFFATVDNHQWAINIHNDRLGHSQQQRQQHSAMVVN